MTKAEIQHIRSLQQKKFRQATGLFVAEGQKMVEELLRSQWQYEVIYSCDPNITAQKPGDRFHSITRKEMTMISGQSTAPDVLAVVRQKQAHPWPDSTTMPSPLVLALDNIADPGNMGTLLRTADWFGVTDVLCSENCVEVYNPKVVQATMGSLFRLNIHRVILQATLSLMRTMNYKLAGAVLNGQPVNTWSGEAQTVLIIGSESHGISEGVQSLLDVRLTIPRLGGSESLNAAVAGGILMHVLRTH